MKKGARYIFNGLTAVSLLLSVAMVGLWLRSRRHEDSVTRLVRGDRYCVISSAGMIGLYGPPPPAADAKVRQAAEEAIAGLDDEQMILSGIFNSVFSSNPTDLHAVWVLTRFNSAAERVETQFAPRDVARPLLAALEDPRRLVVAQLLLKHARPPLQLDTRPIPRQRLGPCADDDEKNPHDAATWATADLDGLTITLNRWKKDGGGGGYASLGQWSHALGGDPDLSQLPRIRDQWHRRLDVRMAAVGHLQAAAVMALPPLVGIIRVTRRRVVGRRRKRSGHCPVCGYDLRATPECCPECGEVPAGAKA